jgi:hypothetical protein
VLFHRPASVQDGAVDAAGQLRGMVNGYRVAQALHVAAMLGISDLLADRRRTLADNAEAAAVTLRNAATRPDS